MHKTADGRQQKSQKPACVCCKASLSHTHTTAEVANLQSLLDGKAPTNHAATATTYGVANGTTFGHVRYPSAATSAYNAAWRYEYVNSGGTHNLNNYTTGGIYTLYSASGTTHTNYPPGLTSASNANTVLLIVYPLYSSTAVKQILMHRNSTQRWERSLIASSWTAWERTDREGILEAAGGSNVQGQIDELTARLTPGARWTQYPGFAHIQSYIQFIDNMLLGYGTMSSYYSSDNIATWQMHNTPLSGASILSASLGNNLVLVAFYSTAGTPVSIIYSRPVNDSSLWTSRVSVSNVRITSICHGGGTFVAVADNGSIRSSTNGTTWTLRTTISGANFTSVCYGRNKFVAVTNDGRTYNSTNGTTWTLESTTSGAAFTSVCFGGITFAAVTSTGQIYSGPNGHSWLLRTTVSGANFASVCHGNGTFVAVASTGQIYSSYGGTSWVMSLNNPDINFSHVCHGNNMFIASSSNRLYTSHSLLL